MNKLSTIISSEILLNNSCMFRKVVHISIIYHNFLSILDDKSSKKLSNFSLDIYSRSKHGFKMVS